MKHPRAWQRMLSGRRLDLLDPTPVDIEIEDIAHGLASVSYTHLDVYKRQHQVFVFLAPETGVAKFGLVKPRVNQVQFGGFAAYPLSLIHI